MTFLEKWSDADSIGNQKVLQEDEECRLVAISEGEIIFCEQFKTVKDKGRAVKIFENTYLRITGFCRDYNINPPSTLTVSDKNSLSKIQLKYKKLILKYEELLEYLS